jgi:hypothetical protein
MARNFIQQKVQKNLKRQEAEHITPAVFLFVCLFVCWQLTHFVTVNLSLLWCKVIQFVVITCAVILDATESLS